MIGPLVDAGHRVIAPDMVGFNAARQAHRAGRPQPARHVEWMTGLVFDPTSTCATSPCSAPGSGRADRAEAGRRRAGPLRPRGRRQHRAADRPRSTQRGLPGLAELQPERRRLPGRGDHRGGLQSTEQSADVVAAYDAPLRRRAPRRVHVMPALVPTSTADSGVSAANIAAWEVLGSFERPLLTASDGDPITASGAAPFEAEGAPSAGPATQGHQGRRPLPPPGGPGPTAGIGDRPIHRRQPGGHAAVSSTERSLTIDHPIGQVVERLADFAAISVGGQRRPPLLRSP